MIPRHVMSAVALLIAVNLLVLIGVASNRLGSPRAQLWLTEREVQLSMASEDDENSGVGLRLELNSDNDNETWFDNELLQQFGFELAPEDADFEERTRIYNRALSRKGYAVLEYEGAAWDAFRRRNMQKLDDIDRDFARGRLDVEDAERRRERIRESLLSASRLFAIDAAVDPESLRAKYADSAHYAIVPVRVRLSTRYLREEKATSVYGRVNLLVDELYLSRGQQKTLAAPIAVEEAKEYHFYSHEGEPRYQVQVVWGQRLEPWVTDVALIARDDG